MNAPVMSRLAITARGRLRRGFFASPPMVVAASKPTREKMQATTARPMPRTFTPLSDSCLVSTEKPCLNRITQARAMMQATEAASRTMRQDGRHPDVLVGDDPAAAAR